MKALKTLLFCDTLLVSVNVSAQTIYITKTGKKYHKTGCRYLKYSKKELTLERALTHGYQACSICKPPKKVSASTQSKATTNKSSYAPNTNSQKSTATQCTAKTKSGSRCKRKTKNANGKCYQHG